MQPQHIGGCRTMLPQIIRAQPTQKRTGGIAAAAAPDRINAPTRDTGQVPGPNPSGTAKPRASRRHSRRSNTHQDRRTHASQRPRTQPNPKRHSQAKSVPAAKPPQRHPAGQKRPRETTGHAPGPTPSGTASSRASRRHSRRSGTRQDKSAHARRRATHPAQTQAAQPPQERTGGIAAAAAPGRTKAPTQDDGPKRLHLA